MHGRVLLVGGFNIHIDKKATPDTITFNDMLEGLNLRNNIEMEMHISDHTLNLIIDDCKDSLVIATNMGHQISDHFFICSTLHIKKPKPQIKITAYRKLKNMNSSKFQEDIQSNLATADEGLSLEEMADYYKATRLALMKICPLETKWLHVNHQQPCFSDKIKEEIRFWRKKENAWLKDPTPTHTRHFSTNTDTTQTSSRVNSKGF